MKNSSFERLLLTLSTVAVFTLGYGPRAEAQAVQSVYSPVIIFYDGLHRYAGSDTQRGWLQMHEDGSGLAQLASGGEFSYVGGAGGRYLLWAQANSAVTLPSGEAYWDCTALHENGDPSTLRILTTDHTLLRGVCLWSADGQHIYFRAKRFAPSGDVVEIGWFLGDVEWVGGEPVRADNERLIAADVPSEYLEVTGLSTDATAQRVAFRMQRDVRDAQGKHVIYETAGLYVAAVPPVVEGQPLPPPATPIRVLLSTPDAERGCCALSPVAGDNRVLYAERAPSKWPYINYFWTVDVPERYDGSYVLVPVQVTSKTNSPANYLHSNWTWSPTGGEIAYVASRNADWTVCHVYKIAANGKGKAVRLTTDQDGYGGVRWRP